MEAIAMISIAFGLVLGVAALGLGIGYLLEWDTKRRLKLMNPTAEELKLLDRFHKMDHDERRRVIRDLKAAKHQRDISEEVKR